MKIMNLVLVIAGLLFIAGVTDAGEKKSRRNTCSDCQACWNAEEAKQVWKSVQPEAKPATPVPAVVVDQPIAKPVQQDTCSNGTCTTMTTGSTYSGYSSAGSYSSGSCSSGSCRSGRRGR